MFYFDKISFTLYCLVALIFFGLKTDLLAQPFKEISLQSKLSNTINNNGVAVADYDNDNDLDIFVVSRSYPNSSLAATSYLFKNNNDGTFSNVTSTSGIESTHNYSDEPPVPGPFGFGEKMSASWGDYDNDGYPDLFLTNVYYYELYHNNQDGTFSNVTLEAGFSEKNDCYNNGALWFDFNNDSFLDLYVTKVYSCGVGNLYKNNGNGTFTEVSESLGIKSSGSASWMAIPWDINEDGYQDLYISNDFDLANELFINNAGQSFENMTDTYGLSDIGKDGMGLVLSDFNNDQLLDLYITNIDESSLYKNFGSDSFNNVADTVGVEKTAWGWGTQFEDFDHDLDLDLMVLNGYHNDTENRYYENRLETGEELFEDKASEYGMDLPSRSNSMVSFDYDNDGDLDILIGRTDDHLEFFENHTIELADDSTKNWVQIALEGTTSNRDAIGSLVELQIGDLVLLRYYHGATLMAQNQLPVHFGLADHTSIDQLTVRWPSGLTESYTDIPINSFVSMTEGSGYEILELGSNKIPGCTDPNSCNYNPNATIDDGSCGKEGLEPISGSTTAGILSEQTYSYPFTEGSTYEWNITNGRILYGQGEPTITVEWGIAEAGEISVIEKRDCHKAPAVLEVTLTSSDAPENASVARMWNEALLEAIRRDYARPTVHARNLFHTSVAMYDAWAVFNQTADTYLIGKQLHNYYNDFQGFETEVEENVAIETAISYAAYRLLSHRFQDSPNHDETQERFDALMNLLGHDPSFTSPDYSNGNPAALGNFIGEALINYGFIDGSNEAIKYGNAYYEPVNEPLVPALPGNPTIQDPNRWQPLQLDVFIDQAGNPVSGTTPEFLSPEWGNVKPFSLLSEDSDSYSRDGDSYIVFHDPGSPPKINESTVSSSDMDLYKWNFSLVSLWSAHLDPFDGVTWDISPAGIGNIDFNLLPTDPTTYDQFYDLMDGGDIGLGRATNPITGQSYEPQIVPRGDYTRVLAEFWADGPDSETPPGHWFVLLNYVSDHPAFERKFGGDGEVLDPLEWDVKAYFTMGGAMHDAAIAAWAVKGWYDYIRPISAIRYMADQGQCSDSTLNNYHIDGIPLIDGFIEVVNEGDILAGDSNEHVGKIKILAWRGHSSIEDPTVDQAGVGWILAENWWPYQRPSFVTPPFAGYVSGHSTYSRAAAEVMTLLTGSEYFPGGMGEFIAPKNEFLVFEEGPSQDIILQWATYQDASDQCSLSRIWGGIHPPADDIPGRIMGHAIGKEAFSYAEKYFSKRILDVKPHKQSTEIYPNPSSHRKIHLSHTTVGQKFQVYDLRGTLIPIEKTEFDAGTGTTSLLFGRIESGLYIIKSGKESWKLIVR